MKTSSKSLTGATLAAAAAALFLAGAAPAPAHAATDGVKCHGTNACKGHGACKSAANACKGQNACKGKGFTMTKDEAECTAKGGSTAEPKG
jgi:hypothetical protein